MPSIYNKELFGVEKRNDGKKENESLYRITYNF